MGRRSQLATVEVVRTKVRHSSAPLTKQKQGTTEGAILDDAALRALRDVFLLFDEWDRAMQDDLQNSSENCKIAVDCKPS